MATAKKTTWAKKPVAQFKGKFAGKKTKATRKVVKSTRKAANSKVANFNSSLQKAWKDAKSSEQKRLVAERKYNALKSQFARKVKTLESKIKELDFKWNQAKKSAANRDSIIRTAANKIVAQFNKPVAKKAKKSSRKTSFSSKKASNWSSKKSFGKTASRSKSSYARRKAA